MATQVLLLHRIDTDASILTHQHWRTHRQ